MFHAIYVSNDQGANSFATVGQDDLLFPPNVMYNNETFRLSKTFQVATPYQEKAFREYCESNHIETNINLSTIK